MMQSYRLPRVHVQFICHQNILKSLDVVQLFTSYYTQILPNTTVTKITLKHDERSSSMKDIPRDKWYYNRCNISSPQVLITMETEGWAECKEQDENKNKNNHKSQQHNQSSYYFPTERAFTDYMMEKVTPTSLQTFILTTLCSDMEIYRAVVEDWSNLTASSFDYDPYLEHSTILLCGGENYIYYDDGDVDSGFVFFGLLVGVIMASMIMGELQLLYGRPTPTRRGGAEGTETTTTTTTLPATSTVRRTSRRRDRSRVDYALAPSEVEMV
jgi:hypothetical protein